MLTFVVRRVLWAVLVMFVITVLVFVIFFKIPGVDPARAIAGRNPSPQIMAEVRHQFCFEQAARRHTDRNTSGTFEPAGFL